MQWKSRLDNRADLGEIGDIVQRRLDLVFEAPAITWIIYSFNIMLLYWCLFFCEFYLEVCTIISSTKSRYIDQIGI